MLLKSLILVVVIAAAAGLGFSRHNPSRYTGNFKAIARGYYRGSGQITVGANSVKISIQIDEDGESNYSRTLQAVLKLDEGRFHGTGSIGGAPIDLDGRVEVGDNAGHGNVKAPRIFCTYGANGQYGRIVGIR